jgi:glc operon protein GlcG
MLQIHSLGQVEAQAAVRAIQAELAQRGKAAVVAVADVYGELIALLRTDGAPVPSIQIASNKAWTSARDRKPSRDVGQAARHPETGYDVAYYGDRRYIGWGGGLPVRIDGHVVGSVAVSGLPELEDIAIAEIGIQAIIRIMGSPDLAPFAPGEKEQLIATIAALPARLSDLIAALTPEQLTARPLAGEWSVAQNVHHLGDSHMNSFIRLKLILTEPNPLLKPYDQDAWAASAEATGADLSDSFALLRGLHARWTHLFASLTDEQWRRTGLHPDYGPMSAIDLLRLYARHGEGHLDQIRRTMAALS